MSIGCQKLKTTIQTNQTMTLIMNQVKENHQKIPKIFYKILKIMMTLLLVLQEVVKKSQVKKSKTCQLKII